MAAKRAELDYYGIVSIVDATDFSEELLRTRLRSLWRLSAPYTIRGPIGNYFLIKFRALSDLTFTVEKGPWSIDNSLLIVDRLQPNMALQAMRIIALPVWVQFWGLPLDYHLPLVGHDLGNVVGTTMTSATGATLYSSQLHFIRVKVQVDPRLPLVQNIKIGLDNGPVRTVECKYERVFRSCANCHFIGHLASACPHSIVQIVEAYDRIATRTFNRFGTRFICNFHARDAELTWQEWIHARRTMGSTRIRFNRALSRYFVFETLPQDVLLNSHRFEGIIHLSDDEFSDDDDPHAADAEQATPEVNIPEVNQASPDGTPSDAEMTDAFTPDNSDPVSPPNDQEDPDYMAFLQTLTSEDLPVPPTSTNSDFMPLTDPLASPSNAHQPAPSPSDSPPSLNIVLSTSPSPSLPGPQGFVTLDPHPIAASPISFIPASHLSIAAGSFLPGGPLPAHINSDSADLDTAISNLIHDCLIIHNKSSEDTGLPSFLVPYPPLPLSRAEKWFLAKDFPRLPVALMSWWEDYKRDHQDTADACGIFYESTPEGDFQWQLITSMDNLFETLFFKHPPFYYSTGLQGSLAFSSDTVEPSKSGFIYLVFDDFSIPAPLEDQPHRITLDNQPPSILDRSPQHSDLHPSPSSTRALKRKAQSDHEDSPKSKKSNTSSHNAVAMEAAPKLLPQGP